MKFLHLTDLHYCPNLDGLSSRNLRESLPGYLQKQHLSADYLLLTGDYRHALLQKGSAADPAAEAAAFIRRIASAAGVPIERVLLVPGNHDRERSQGDAAKRYEQIRKSYTSSCGTFAPEDRAFLVKEFDFFYQVCAHLYGKSADPWSKRPLHTFHATDDAVFLMLNTAILHTSSYDRECRNLILGTDELDHILTTIQREHRGLPIIILAHHAMEYLAQEERYMMENLFRACPVQLYLCGDAHTLWWRPCLRECLEITMGCLKSERGTQAAFLYGDTDAHAYTAYDWDGTFDIKRGWGPYVQFNESLQAYFGETIPELNDEIIRREQSQMQNEVVLPWLRDSVSYLTIFPELFMKPVLEGKKVRGLVPYGELVSQHSKKNLVILGEAGIGKSTLLKYIFLFENENMEFLYLKASALQRTAEELTDYEQAVLCLLRGEKETRTHKTILLDGMDESYTDAMMEDLIQALGRSRSQLSIWFGWRTEHYYQKETERLSRWIDNVLALPPWDIDTAEEYVRIYAKKTDQQMLQKKFHAQVQGNDTLLGFIASPFQLTLLVYLLEDGTLLPDAFTQSLVAADLTIYKLYEAFFRCWLKKERLRKTSDLPETEIRQILWAIARKIYYGQLCPVDCTDSAVTDLLIFSPFPQGEQRLADRFYHRSLCAFFYADSIFAAIQQGGIPLVEALNQPLKNDITDFVRSASSTISSVSELERLQKNLMDTYLYTITRSMALDLQTRRWIDRLPKEKLFCLKNEIIYLVTRLATPDSAVSSFVEAAYQHETDPYLKLDLAYGAVLVGPAWITLEYARSLTPGSEADRVHRAWTLAYFGDVQADPYSYQDMGQSGWTKARTARLKRLQSSKRKAIRFRILDLPVLYCFYESRNWRDICKQDYLIIQQARIDCEEYSEEERQFLSEQKTKLLNKCLDKLGRD